MYKGKHRCDTNFFFFFVMSVINIYNCDISLFLVVKEKILFVLVFKGNFVLFNLV